MCVIWTSSLTFRTNIDFFIKNMPNVEVGVVREGCTDFPLHQRRLDLLINQSRSVASSQLNDWHSASLPINFCVVILYLNPRVDYIKNDRPDQAGRATLIFFFANISSRSDELFSLFWAPYVKIFTNLLKSILVVVGWLKTSFAAR